MTIAELRAELARLILAEANAYQAELTQNDINQIFQQNAGWSQASHDTAVQLYAQKAAITAHIREQIAETKKAIEALDAAAAAAVAQGFTPEDGYKRAEAALERSKALKYVAMGVGILIVLGAVYWFILRKR
jgi:hypothetical protein